MWVIGGGIMVGGLLSMVIIGIPIGLVIIGAGAAIAAFTEQAENKARQAEQNAWRKTYPSYKY